MNVVVLKLCAVYTYDVEGLSLPNRSNNVIVESAVRQLNNSIQCNENKGL